MECILCLGVREPHLEDLNVTRTSPFEEYLKVCKKYLTVEIADVQLNNSTLVCTVCFCSVETLFKIHKNLQEVQERLIEYSLTFSEVLSNRRSGKIETEDFDTIEVKPDLETEQYPIEAGSSLDEDDDNILHHSDSNSPLSIHSSPQIKNCAERKAGTTRRSSNETYKTNKLCEKRDTKTKSDLQSKRSKVENSTDESTLDEDSQTDEDCVDTYFGCWKCSKKFKTKEEFDVHSRSHITKKIICTCSICEKTFSSKTQLEKHIVGVHGQRTYECKTCGKMYKTESNLKSHLKGHTNTERNYKCDICEKSYFWSSNLQLHKRKVHSIGQPYINKKVTPSNNLKTYFCDQCGKTCLNKTLFDEHRRIHTGEMPFKCDVNDCGKTFRLKCSLKNHKMTVHSTNFPFVCPYDLCNKKYKLKFQLNQHCKMSHSTNNKKDIIVNCTECNKKFSSKLLLKCHVTNVHRKDSWKFICNICGVRSPSSYKLQNHIRTHTGEKPFQCDHCKKRFTSKDRLGQHRKEKSH